MDPEDPVFAAAVRDARAEIQQQQRIEDAARAAQAAEEEQLLSQGDYLMQQEVKYELQMPFEFKFFNL